MKSKFNKKSMVNKVVNNKFVLYFVALLALLDILGYIMRKEFSAVLLFYLVGMITYFYTKNMTIVLGSALVFTTIIHVFSVRMGYKEGMKGGKKEGLETSSPSSSEVSIAEAVEEEEEEEEEEEFTNKTKPKAKKKKSGYQNQQKLNPALYNIPNKDELSKQLGKADNMEKAYDNLEKVVGENGIKSMSNNTRELVKEQKKLLNNLKEITPALDEAVGAMNKIDLGKIMGTFKMFNKNKVEDDDDE